MSNHTATTLPKLSKALDKKCELKARKLVALTVSPPERRQDVVLANCEGPLPFFPSVLSKRARGRKKIEKEKEFVDHSVTCCTRQALRLDFLH